MYLLENRPWILLVNALYLLGGSLEITRYMLVIELLLGATILAYWVNWFMKGRARVYPFLAGAILFMAGTVGLILIGRSGMEIDLGATLPSRYKMFPYVILALTWFSVWQEMSTRLRPWALVAFCGLLLVPYLTSYQFADKAFGADNALHKKNYQAWREGHNATYIWVSDFQKEECGAILANSRYGSNRGSARVGTVNK
jgi:hypothetical protein